jgi:Flp pilus assembly protein TadB
VSGKAQSRRDATRTDPAVAVRRSADPSENVGIVRGLAWLFRRPLAAILLVLALMLGIAMLIWPLHVLEALAVIGGLFIVYQAGRHARH